MNAPIRQGAVATRPTLEPCSPTIANVNGQVPSLAAGGQNELPGALAATHEAFRQWLGEGYDLDVLDVVLCAAAVERLDGDPVWLLVVSGAGAAKTETVGALAGAGAYVTSTLSGEAALLSGTARNERSRKATGGLLRKIGDRGLLVIKDVTSILSMNRDTRGLVLAALREVYDGRWERNLGIDGGRTLTWTGRIVVVGAVTTAWDQAHAVISAMGDRFVLVRLDSGMGRLAAGRQAISNTGKETQMRAELSDSVAALLNTVDLTTDLTLPDEEAEQLLRLADLVTKARTGVERDYRGDVVDAHAPEMPTRFAKQLTQIVRGGLALGMSREHARRLSSRCARDSIPPLRLTVLLDVRGHPRSRVADVRSRVQKPRATVDRCLQELHMLGLVQLHECEEGPAKTVVWRYSLASDAHDRELELLCLPEMSPQGE